MVILDRKKKKALDGFVRKTDRMLGNLAKKSSDKHEKALYERMRKEITSTPLLIYDRKALHLGIGSATLGEHVVEYYFVKKGKSTGIIAKKFIRVPAWHVFSGDEISSKGAFTLWHEWAHFPKSWFNGYLVSRGIPADFAEETAADILATILAREFGYSEASIRARSFGRMPFSMISALVGKLMKK
jgi:hypothetical protein